MTCTQFGPIWKQKIRTFHTRLDQNGDGLVTKDDFLLMAQRLVTVAHATPRQAQQVQDALFKLWNVFLAENAASDSITADGYIAALQATGKKAISKIAHEISSAYFDALDANGDGHISLEEFSTYYQVKDIDKSHAEGSFNAVDSDHDGYISRAEFLFAIDDFFTSENWNSFFGPAVEEK
jgi:Ca2+-binding EF-hand superfamily protein